MNPASLSTETLMARAVVSQQDGEPRVGRANPLEEVAGVVRGRIESASLLDVAIVGGVVLFFVAIGWALSRWSRRFGGRVSHPERLFRELCEIHRLNRAEANALRALAQAIGSPPAHVFVRPSAFDAYPELADLKTRLFA